jgi:hypothetical protein
LTERLVSFWACGFNGLEVALQGWCKLNTGNALDPKDILTPGELAKRLKVSVNWVYEKSRNRGHHSGTPLPCLRVGRYLRFAWPDIVAWMRDPQRSDFS